MREDELHRIDRIADRDRIEVRRILAPFAALPGDLGIEYAEPCHETLRRILR